MQDLPRLGTMDQTNAQGLKENFSKLNTLCASLVDFCCWCSPAGEQNISGARMLAQQGLTVGMRYHQQCRVLGTITYSATGCKGGAENHNCSAKAKT